MANPNLLGITTVTGITTHVGITSSYGVVLSNSASSGRLYKIISMLASNSSGTLNGSLNIFLHNQSAGAGTSTYIVRDVVVSAKSMLTILDKNNPIYLQENKSIVAIAVTSNTVDLTIVYEDIS